MSSSRSLPLFISPLPLWGGGLLPFRPLPCFVVGTRGRYCSTSSTSTCTTQNSASYLYYSEYLYTFAGKLYLFFLLRTTSIVNHTITAAALSSTVRKIFSAGITAWRHCEYWQSVFQGPILLIHAASTAGSMPFFNAAHAASKLAVLRILYVCTA